MEDTESDPQSIYSSILSLAVARKVEESYSRQMWDNLFPTLSFMLVSKRFAQALKQDVYYPFQNGY